MKYVKMLGLAAVAAAALMAFVGASSASATVLCKTTGTGSPTGTTCPEGQAYSKGTVIQASLESGQHATLTSHSEFAPNITCEKSEVEGSTDAEGGEGTAVTGSISKLTFEKCNCTVTVIKKGSLSVSWLSGTHNGTLRGTGQEITTVCPSIFGNIHCIYVTNNTDLGELRDTATGGTLEANSVAIERLKTDELCPTAPTWDAKYTVTKPTPLSVTGET